MIRIAICDDDPKQLSKIQETCDAYFTYRSDIDVNIFSFSNPNDFLDKMEKTGGFDVVLLDICMPGITGIKVGKEIRKRNDKTEIIYLSTSDEFYGEAYSVKATRYLHKPFAEEDLHEALDNVLKLVDAPAGKRIQVFGENGAIHVLEAKNILYVESFRTYRTIHSLNGTYNDTKRSLGKLMVDLNLLYPGRFISPVRGYIVNLENVISIDMEGITMKNRQIVPIKAGSFRKLRDIYLDYLFGKEV